MHFDNPCDLLSEVGELDCPERSSTQAPIEVTSGPVLCRLRVWSDREWAELPEAERPLRWVHAPGLGWVGAVPISCMN